MSLKICVSTSNKYLHLIPVFEYLYLKYWGDLNIEIVGYDKPETSLPFYSMGKQGDVSQWSTDLRRYFEKQDQFFIWIMEDTLLKAPVEKWKLGEWERYLDPAVGRIDLTNDMTRRGCQKAHFKGSEVDMVFSALPNTNYRLSTQPSIWNKEFLLEYLTPGLTPWKFEVQHPDNKWLILGRNDKTVYHNEGVRKSNIFELDLNGLPEEDIAYLKNHNSWIK